MPNAEVLNSRASASGWQIVHSPFMELQLRLM